jgi:hypothetical protein
MTDHHSSQHFTDTALAGWLLAAPAWAPWLDDFNRFLMSASLLVGLALGLSRLWRLWCSSRNKHRD